MKTNGHVCTVSLGLIVILLLTIIGSIDAQSERRNSYWINFGVGASSVGEDGGGSMNFSTSYQLGKNVFTLRAMGSGELFGEELHDYSLLYGRTFTSSTFLASLSVGLGLVDGQISHVFFRGRKDRNRNAARFSN